MNWIVWYALGALLWIGGMIFLSVLVEEGQREQKATARLVVLISPVWPIGVVMAVAVFAALAIRDGRSSRMMNRPHVRGPGRTKSLSPIPRREGE